MQVGDNIEDFAGVTQETAKLGGPTSHQPKPPTSCYLIRCTVRGNLKSVPFS